MDNPRNLGVCYTIVSNDLISFLVKSSYESNAKIVRPTLMLNNQTRDEPIGNRDFFGWSLWAIGMIFEVIAE